MRPPPARWNANPDKRTQIASEVEDGVGIITPWRAAPARTVHPDTGRGGFDLDACSPAAAVASGTDAYHPKGNMGTEATCFLCFCFFFHILA